MAHPVFETLRGEGDAPLLGGWITFDAMPVAELLSGAGFDYIGIDLQHSMIEPQGAYRLLYAMSHSVAKLVRVASHDGTAIGKLLDCGADGVIVPMIETAEQAADAVAACRYGPAGKRSFGPVRPHIGRDPRALEARASCFAMIETAGALARLAEIVAVPGLTGLYLGPADLAVALETEQVGAGPLPAAVVEAASAVAAACCAQGIVAGAHALSAAQARELAVLGFTMVTLAADKGYLLSGAATMLADARREA
jgi:2-keto-3-deoxy-L-rhamnonate aldolase RhmA